MNASHALPALTLNARTLQLCGPAQRIDVSYAEYALLCLFAQSEQQRVATPQLLEHLGKLASANAKRALEVQLVRLRKKLEQAGAAAPTIKAMRGFGYQLCICIAVMPAPTFVRVIPDQSFPPVTETPMASQRKSSLMSRHPKPMIRNHGQ